MTKCKNMKGLKKVGMVLVMLALVMPHLTFANSPAYSTNENFDNKFHEPWYFVNFEDDNGAPTRNPGVQCSVDACAKLVKEGSDDFLQISVRPTTVEGVYTNTDISEVELGLPTSPESGSLNPELNKDVVMEAKVRWSEGYNLDGSGSAVGTSGIILWNSAVDEAGPLPEYDQIGFSWAKNTIMGGYVAGLTASSVIDLMPFQVSRPLDYVDMHDWVDLKLVWSVDGSGQQQVEYFVNEVSIGTHLMLAPLHNLSVEMWNDNQEPTFGPDGFVTEYPSPEVEQSFDIDSVRVKYQQN